MPKFKQNMHTTVYSVEKNSKFRYTTLSLIIIDRRGIKLSSEVPNN